MSDIVIKAENLGKSYIIGHEATTQYTALRDVIAGKARKIISKTRQVLKGGQLIAGNELEEFWALQDLNFDIKQGERVGIIGRNGAGKSTLLKVLSRITEPTKGRIRIKGRVASLLEVGTGFHPELTGRENIFLNGAILGMSRVEIRKKFDEIVDFSGVEKFLDTPVKKYSSGMYVRLAFAVAANLEPEILVVDEVLAVGDAEFQKKCLGKMESVSSKEGRTVLFVSHNMGAIKELCNKGILLKNGQLEYLGEIDNCISKYIIGGKYKNNSYVLDFNCDKQAFIKEIYIENEAGELADNFDVHDQITLKLKVKINEPLKGLIVVLDLKMNGILLYRSYSSDCNPDQLNEMAMPGEHSFSCKILNPLKKGFYSIDLKIGTVMIADYDIVYDAVSFEIDESRSNLQYKSYWNERPGLIATNIEWQID